MSPTPNVLVIRFGSLGDVVLTTPLVRALHHTYPDARITVVTKEAYVPVLQHNPHVHDVIPLAPGVPVTTLARRLGRRPWDLRLDLHGTPRAFALRMLLGGRWRGYSKRRLRRWGLIRLHVGRDRRPTPVAERYFDAVRDLGVQPDGAPCEVHPGPDDLARARDIYDGRPIVLAPGATHATKRWPAARWQDLARRLVGAGAPVVGVGLRKERDAVAGAGAIDAFGIGLGPTAAILERARAVVAHDSGLLHLATAVRTPVVALYGPTVRALGFFPYRARAIVVERALPCRPCSAYGGPHCPLGHHRCMLDLDPAEVLTAVQRLASTAEAA